jgi:hypothetical protein
LDSLSEKVKKLEENYLVKSQSVDELKRSILKSVFEDELEGVDSERG